MHICVVGFGSLTEWGHEERQGWSPEVGHSQSGLRMDFVLACYLLHTSLPLHSPKDRPWGWDGKKTETEAVIPMCTALYNFQSCHLTSQIFTL